MRVYRLDDKLYDNDIYDYLCDRGIPRSGQKWELLLEIRIWNFIAKIVNYLRRNNVR